MAETRVTHYARYLVGGTAAAISLPFLLGHIERPELAVVSLVLLALCIIDTRHSRIPNLATVPLALFGLAFNTWQGGLQGLGMAVMGLLLGLGLLMIPHVMGGMGAGDVKAMAALGAVVGPGAIFQVFLYTALFGGLFSLLHLLAGGTLLKRLAAYGTAVFAFAASRDRGSLNVFSAEGKSRLPYAAAIAFGFYAFSYWGPII